MKISAVGNQQTGFNGYVHESVTEFVKRASFNERQKLLSVRNEALYEKNLIKVKEIEALAENILKKLSDFFAQCHPQTYIAIKYSRNGYNTCMVTNEQLSKIKIHDIDLIRKSQGADITLHAVSNSYPITPQETMFNSLNGSDIELLNKYTETLVQKVEPQNVDRALLNKYRERVAKRSKKWGMGIFSGLISKIMSRRANSFEKELKET